MRWWFSCKHFFRIRYKRLIHSYKTDATNEISCISSNKQWTDEFIGLDQLCGIGIYTWRHFCRHEKSQRQTKCEEWDVFQCHYVCVYCVYSIQYTVCILLPSTVVFMTSNSQLKANIKNTFCYTILVFTGIQLHFTMIHYLTVGQTRPTKTTENRRQCWMQSNFRS